MAIPQSLEARSAPGEQAGNGGFLPRIEAYLAASGMAASAFGEQAIGDAMFVTKLRRGRDPKLSTVARVEAFIVAHPVEKYAAKRRARQQVARNGHSPGADFSRETDPAARLKRRSAAARKAARSRASIKRTRAGA